MRIKFIEATNQQNWGKFGVGVFTEQEWAQRSQINPVPIPLLTHCGWASRHLWVMDLQTGEGAIFMPNPNGSPSADLDKHRIWVCPMFEPFLAWLYQQDLTDVDALPALVELEAQFRLHGHRRRGPAQADH